MEPWSPGAGRVGRAAGEVDAAASQFDEEEGVDSSERDRLDGEEVDREHAWPAGAGTLARRACGGYRLGRARLAQDFRTVVDDTFRPSPLISPAIRWSPQRAFSRARRSTSSRISPPIGGRPLRLAYVQRRATSRRCQRSSVAGVTRNDSQHERGSSRLAAVSKSRSL